MSLKDILVVVFTLFQGLFEVIRGGRNVLRVLVAT